MTVNEFAVTKFSIEYSMSMPVSPDVRCAVSEVLIVVTETNLVTTRNVD